LEFSSWSYRWFVTFALEGGADKTTRHTRFRLPCVARRELHAISDCGSGGMPLGLWLNSRGHIFGSFCSDVLAHDMTNSVKAAVDKAELWLVVLESALCCNFHKAPFGTDGHFSDARAATLDFIQFSRQDPYLWDAIRKGVGQDLGQQDDIDCRTLSSSELLDFIESHPELHKPGSTVKLNRWFHVWDRYWTKLQPVWTMSGAIGIYNGLQRAWFVVSDELLVAAVGSGAPKARSVLSGHADLGRGVARSSQLLCQLKGEAKCLPHLVSLILCNPMTRKLMGGMAIFVSEVRLVHGCAMKAARNPDTCLELRVHRAQGGALEELLKIASVAADGDKLVKGSFMDHADAQVASSEELEFEDRACNMLFIFVVHVLGQRWCSTSCFEFTFPWKCAALLETCEVKLAETLKVLESWLAAILALDEECLANHRAQKFRLSLVWVVWEWPRYVLETLEEYSFQKVAFANL
jgi:hypothetical protein